LDAAFGIFKLFSSFFRFLGMENNQIPKMTSFWYGTNFYNI